MTSVKKRRFRLLQRDNVGNRVGPHYMGGLRFGPGDVVESNLDLTVAFRNKFEEVPAGTPLSKGRRTFDDIVPANQRTAVPVDTAESEGVTAPPDSANTLQDQPVAKIPEDFRAKPTKKAKSYGIDVTDDFPDAIAANIRVYYNAKAEGYVIIDADSAQVLKRVKQERSVTKFAIGQAGA